MEGVELEDPALFPATDDFSDSILSLFADSTQEEHQRLCAVIGGISQELKDHNLPSTPTAFFYAASDSLHRLSSSSDPPPADVIESLVTVLSLVLPKVPLSILNKKREFVSGIVVWALKLNSATVGAVVSGLKCAAELVIAREKVSWADVAHLYNVFLEFMTDSRPKVRKQSHECIRDMLQAFRGTSALAPASEGVVKTFERFLLLAGGSSAANADANGSEGAKGAQQVLCILEAFKECLPLMSMKYATAVLKYYKTLLELRQPVVTRRVTDSLNVVFLNPSSDVSAEALLDLLCILALHASTNETSADNLTFTARLLDAGMRKVFGLNRQICVVKLPVVFSALKDILAMEYEEAIFAATTTSKSLINNCIDDGLIRQGADQIMASKNVDTRKSGPTVIEKVCATIDSLLDYHYSAVWDMVFQIVSTMFDRLGIVIAPSGKFSSCSALFSFKSSSVKELNVCEASSVITKHKGNYSSYFMKGTLKNLADMQRLSDDDFPYRKQLHECLGSALGAMGPETFLTVLPLNLDANDLSEVNAWLFPILKQYTVGARLSYFTDAVISMADLAKQKSQRLEHEGRIVAARSIDGLVYSLWSLLPSFCNYPVDTAESFKDLEKPLCDILSKEENVRGVICSALQVLIQQNKRIVEGKEDPSGTEVSIARQHAMARYTMEVATENLDVLKSSARQFLTVLSGILLESSKDDGGCLQSTINEFSAVADKAVVSRIFIKTMNKVLKVMQEATKIESSTNSNTMQVDESSNEKSLCLQRARLFDLAVSLLPGLDVTEIAVLFDAVRPALQDAEGLIQKKGYKVLSQILQNHDEFLSSKLQDLLQVMIDVLPSCHFSAKRYRLDCLYHLIVHVSKDNSEQMGGEILGSFLTEIILALKEANKKTRNRAYDLLVQIGHAYGDEDNGGRKENLHEFFNLIAGGLAGETPHMVSAAMKGLARLAYEFSDLVSTAYKLLPSTFLLLQRKNREIVKANLGLLKVLVAKSQTEGLQMHLGSMVESLLKWQDDTKNHFKAKVKHLLEMLVKKCGLEAVKAVMPEEHMKLLTNIRKIKERRERKHATNSMEAKSQLSRATTSRLSRWNHTKIFSDFGDEETEDSDGDSMDTRTVSGRKSKAFSRLKSKASTLRSKRNRSGKSLPEDLYDQMDDEPLDLLDRRKTRSALRSSEHLKRKQDSDDEPEIDSEGRLVISEGGKAKKARPHPDPDTRSESGSLVSMSSSRKAQKRRKTSESGWAYTGSEYSSKKAGGDVTRKDKLEPYAYWPLDRKMMSRRPEQRAAARKGMASVVKMTKKLEGKSASGALKHLKLKKKGNKRKSS
ncbi:hypothetical protein Tsubulata_029798 [Turnera subulata]|uniref:Ribosomal RNA-processing protein 12-like conserved domain-containing protein n=1 Tax=Turnera subulata TaxID=218843 RepID=A0A9Q0FCA5_9ROSI|nr:hypothetical protein Tsubulata_029798 [Turnera subulata]